MGLGRGGEWLGLDALTAARSQGWDAVGAAVSAVSRELQGDT